MSSGDSHMRQRKLIILGSKNHSQVDAVLSACERIGVETALINPENSTALSFNEDDCSIELDGKAIYPFAICPLDKYFSTPFGFTDEWAKLRANHMEWSGALDNFITYFDDITFNPYCSRHLEQMKLLQLRVARDVGLKTPKSLLTNCPRAIQATFDGQTPVIVKPIGVSNLPLVRQPGVVEAFSPEVRAYAVEELVEFFEQHHSAPVLVQDFIERDFDYRISVIGSEIIAAKISKPEGLVDSRKLGINQVFELVDIPANLRSSLFAFMKRFALSFGHFDFMYDNEDRFVFLECNPDGMWVFYDREHCISSAYAKFFDEASRSVGSSVAARSAVSAR